MNGRAVLEYGIAKKAIEDTKVKLMCFSSH